MRIAIATDWFAPRLGGIEAQLAGLAEGLAGRGHEIDVLTSTAGTTAGTGYRIDRVPTRRMPFTGVALSPTLPAMLERRFREGGYDVVHAHISVVSPCGYAAIWAAQRAGIPTVVTFHSVLYGARGVVALTRALLGASGDAIVWTGVSTLVAAQVKKAISSDDVTVLPNAARLDWWRSRETIAARPADEIVVASAMRLHRKKRPRALLRAFAAAVQQTGRRARLVLAGDGPERPHLVRDATRLLEPTHGRLDLPGWLDATALRALYAASDIFAIASRREAFGIAALEARVAGLPVVAMRQAGSTEFLHDGVDAVLCDDDAGIERALTRLIGDAAFRRTIAAATPDLQRYDWPHVLAEHERVYDGAIRRARREVPADEPSSRRSPSPRTA